MNTAVLKEKQKTDRLLKEKNICHVETRFTCFPVAIAMCLEASQNVSFLFYMNMENDTLFGKQSVTHRLRPTGLGCLRTSDAYAVTAAISHMPSQSSPNMLAKRRDLYKFCNAAFAFGTESEKRAQARETDCLCNKEK